MRKIFTTKSQETKAIGENISDYTKASNYSNITVFCFVFTLMITKANLFLKCRRQPSYRRAKACFFF